MMNKVRLGFLVVCVAFVGCSSKPPVDPNIAACPEATIRVLQDNQAFMQSIRVGETPSSKLRSLRGLAKSAVLVLGDDKMDVAFYYTGLPMCPWVIWGETLTPVVVRDGVIIGFGGGTVKDLTAHGWVLKEAKWPWQRYDFGYLPRD